VDDQEGDLLGGVLLGADDECASELLERIGADLA
jgi:hypothetical protein